MGHQRIQCQEDEKILGMFTRDKAIARRKYREFV
jgi:hypothetical protein